MNLSAEQIRTTAQNNVQRLTLEIKKIEKEIQKNQSVIAFITDCESRDTTLQSEAVSTTQQQTLSPAADSEKPQPVHLRDDSLTLLRTLYEGALTTNVVAVKCRQAGLNIQRLEVTRRLGHYKRHYGFVEVVKRGLYRLSDKGRRYLDENYPIDEVSVQKINNKSSQPKLPVAPNLWQDDF